jgi:hypothetical protein
LEDNRVAIAFLRETGLLTAALADLYTPSAVPAIVFSGVFTNIGSQEYLLTIEVEDNGATTFRDIVTNLPIPVGDAWECPKIVLQASDSLRAKADATDAIEYNISIVEDPLN